MKEFKRTLRRVGYITLMLMAAIAVGITGVAPVFPKNRERQNEIELVAELHEEPKQATPWEELIR